MKKILIIGVIVALALILVGGAGVVYARIRGIDNNAVVTVNGAQIGDDIVRQFGYGPGNMMGGYGNSYGPGSMMSGDGYGYGPGGMMEGYGYGYGPGGMMGGEGYGYGTGGMMGGRGNGYGPGNMMGGRGNGYGYGMMGDRGVGIMHDYMIAAFAKAVGLTVEQVDTRLAGGETLKEIAIAQGTTEDQLPDLAIQVRKNALDLAVADGVITQAQADQMLEHMKEYDGQGLGSGFGIGDCPMWDEDDVQQP